MGSDGSAVMHHHAMVALVLSLLGALRSALRSRADVVLENLALRQQLANLRRTSSRPRSVPKPIAAVMQPRDGRSSANHPGGIDK